MALDPDGPRNCPLLWAPAVASPAAARCPAQPAGLGLLAACPRPCRAHLTHQACFRPRREKCASGREESHAHSSPPRHPPFMTDSTHPIQISPGTPSPHPLPQCPSRMWCNITVPAWSPKSSPFRIIFCDHRSHFSSPSSAPFDLPCQAGSLAGFFKARGPGSQPSGPSPERRAVCQGGVTLGQETSP